ILLPLAKRLGRVIYCANPRQISRRATRGAEPKRTRTVGRASVSLGGAAVIWIEGQSAPVALRACTAIS
ncbi:hypothetical protein OFL37_16780, partial [Pseudomonas aeruginosa]|nr:hypothetical protein [Pseudomonas aeruginosa]